MPTLEFRTAGESHGPAVITLIEGFPAGIEIDAVFINRELQRRQGGYGRSARQKLEQDQADIKSGVRQGVTIGSPIIIEIVNRDFRIDQTSSLTRPRPGHADFAGSIKWLATDCRAVLERASARETCARVAAGAMVRSLLNLFNISVVGYVKQIGSARSRIDSQTSVTQLASDREKNEVYCPDLRATEAMVEQIQQAKKMGDTIGGIVEVVVFGLPPGLGSCARWQDRLDGRLMQALGAIQAIKGVEIGAGFGVADQWGSQVHDEIHFDLQLISQPHFGFVRKTNNAGGLEGGMTNGQPLVIRAAMKPINTLIKGLKTVDLETKESVQTQYERSDICAVPAASVVAENAVAFEIARAFLEKFGGDTIREVQNAYHFFLESARKLGFSSSNKG